MYAQDGQNWFEQLRSERCLRISQKNNEIFSRISALVLKRGQIKKVVKESQIKSSNYRYKEPLFFWFYLFLEARAEISENILLVFGRFEDTKRTFWN